MGQPTSFMINPWRFAESAASLRPDAHDPPLILSVVRPTPVQGVPVNAPTHVGYLFNIFFLPDLYTFLFKEATPPFCFPRNIIRFHSCSLSLVRCTFFSSSVIATTIVLCVIDVVSFLIET